MSKITHDGLTQSGTRCFTAVPEWQQWALKGFNTLGEWQPVRQPVGICTVQRSSDDSSVDVPMKSNVKQLRTRCNVWLSRPCWRHTTQLLPATLYNWMKVHTNQMLLTNESWHIYYLLCQEPDEELMFSALWWRWKSKRQGIKYFWSYFMNFDLYKWMLVFNVQCHAECGIAMASGQSIHLWRWGIVVT